MTGLETVLVVLIALLTVFALWAFSLLRSDKEALEHELRHARRDLEIELGLSDRLRKQIDSDYDYLAQLHTRMTAAEQELAEAKRGTLSG